MKHIIINDFGLFLGLKSQRLSIKKDGSIINEVALNRIKTIQVLSRGVSLSSDLINSCSQRGIKIFFNTFNSFSAIHSIYEHKSVMVRVKQFEICQNQKGLALAKQLIIGKLKNQRATLLYSSRNVKSEFKNTTIEFFDKSILQLKNKKELSKEFILGIEGVCADKYFGYDDGVYAAIRLLNFLAHNDKTLDEVLNDSFAITREASKRTLNMRHYDVQLIGGMVLHDGRIAEMKTGEGKTLVGTLAVALNALSGK